MRTLTISDPGMLQATPPLSAYLASALADSPLAVWMMDETSGTTMTDSSGNGRHGSYGGGVTLGSIGPTGLPAAASFDGTNDYASAAIDLSALGTSAAITVEGAWYVSSWPGATGFLFEYTANWNSNNGTGLATTTSSGGRLEFGVSQGGAFRSRYLTPRPSAAGWHFYSVILDRGSGGNTLLSLRVDGIEQTTTSLANATVSAAFANSSLYLMSRAGSSAFLAGRCAGVAVYSGRLSNTRRDAHATAALT